MEGLVEGQCERVFGALVKGVGVGGGEVKGVGEGVGGGREGASVNLVRGPVGVEGMWGVEEGEGFTGMFLFFLAVFSFFLFFFSFLVFGTGVNGCRAGGGRGGQKRGRWKLPCGLIDRSR